MQRSNGALLAVSDRQLDAIGRCLNAVVPDLPRGANRIQKVRRHRWYPAGEQESAERKHAVAIEEHFPRNRIYVAGALVT